MRKNELTKLTLSAMFLALALLLPFLTGQIQQIGSMLWGLAVGFIAPLLRSALFSMPPMFPKAFCMAFELATYGVIAGWLHHKLPKRKLTVYLTLLTAMIAGRLVWGILMFACLGFDVSKFGFHAFLSGAVIEAVPGILLQLLLIPVLVISLEKILYKNK